MRRTLIAGNWKLNGSLAANANLLAEIKLGLGTQNCDVLVCVPAVYLAQCAEILDGRRATEVAVGGFESAE